MITKRGKINYFVDIVLLFSFLIAGITGIIKFGTFLRAIGINLNYAELPMRTISLWHDWAGLIMVLFVFIHLVLHFRWLVVMTKEIFFKKNEK